MVSAWSKVYIVFFVINTLYNKMWIYIGYLSVSFSFRQKDIFSM